MTDKMKEISYSLIMLIIGIIVIINMTGCVLKSTLVKELEPVDKALVVITTIDCGVLQVGSEEYVKCEFAKFNAERAHEILKGLGVNPQSGEIK